MSPVLEYNHNIAYIYCILINYVIIGVQKLLHKKSIFSTGKGWSIPPEFMVCFKKYSFE